MVEIGTLAAQQHKRVVVTVRGAEEPRAVADPVGCLEPQHILVEGCGLLPVRHPPGRVQEFLESDAVVHGGNSALVHPDVELDVGSAGIGEPQPALHAVAPGVTTLENLDVLFSQPAGNFLQSVLTGDFVTNSLDALLVSLLKPNPMVLDA